MRLKPEKEAEILRLDTKNRKAIRDEITVDILRSDKHKQLLLSAAGTGKTFLFREKIKKWIKENVPQDQILVTSFINFIVEDLRFAVHNEENLPEVKVFTLHKLAKIILHKYIGVGGKFSEPLEADFQIALGNDEINIASDVKTFNSDIKENPEQVLEALNNYFQNPSKYPEPHFFSDYQKIVSFYNTVTFNDSIPRATQALQKRPNLIPIKKILVDEYQDFNEAEQNLIAQILEKSEGGVIAGDDDQSLYLSKKADSEGIIGLYNHDDWENVSLPFCSRTRSAAVVLSAADICRHQKRSNRVDKSYLPLEDNKQKIKIADLLQSRSGKNTFLIEAEYISKHIDPEKIKSWKESYPAYLILGKSKHLKRLAKVIEERTGFSVALKPTSIYEEQAVQIFHSYIQLLGNPKNNLAYRRLLGLKDKATPELILEAINKNDFSSLENREIEIIRKNIEALAKISSQEKTTEEILWEMIKFLKLKKSPSLVEYVEQIKGRKSLEQISGQLDEMTIEQMEKERKQLLSNPIQALTIKSSKGLKAETVFVLGLEEGYLPRINAEPTDEEINLIYVAMTRAVESLHLLSCRFRADGVFFSFGSEEGKKNKSVFLSWLSPNNINTTVMGKKDFLV